MATVVTIAAEGGSYTPILAEGPFEYGGNLYAVCAEAAGDTVLVYKSTDGGATWALASSGGPVIKSATIGFTFFRSFLVACQDSNVIRCFVGSIADDVGHQAFDMATDTWDTLELAGELFPYGVLGPGFKSADCALVSAGKVAVTYQLYYEFSPGAFTVGARVVLFDAGSFGTAQWVDDGTSTAVVRVACGSIGGRTHLFYQQDTVYTHRAMSSSGTLAAPSAFVDVGVAGSGLYRHVKTWSYGGNDYVGLAYAPSQELWVGWAVSADSPTFIKKQAYTRVSGEFGSHDSTAILLPKDGSLHVIFAWWTLSGTIYSRVYKNCVAFTTAVPTFGTAEKIHEQPRSSGTEEFIAHIDGYLSGSEARVVLGATGADSGSTFLKYLTETLATCSAPDCCCANFAY